MSEVLKGTAPPLGPHMVVLWGGARYPCNRTSPVMPTVLVVKSIQMYRGTSVLRNRHPPGTTIGPQSYSYCRVLGGCAVGGEVPL